MSLRMLRARGLPATLRLAVPEQRLLREAPRCRRVHQLLSAFVDNLTPGTCVYWKGPASSGAWSFNEALYTRSIYASRVCCAMRNFMRRA